MSSVDQRRSLAVLRILLAWGEMYPALLQDGTGALKSGPSGDWSGIANVGCDPLTVAMIRCRHRTLGSPDLWEDL